MLLGSATGRDGIGGVSVLASAGFEEGDDDKRPSVQVGDPFEEKRLIEACLALLDAGLVVGIQDLGGAGLTCATSETASRGDVGMDVDVSSVPCREPGMEPFEVMTSESQERMLAIVTPEGLDEVLDLCARWEVQATVIGRVTEAGSPRAGRLRILDGFDGPVLADVPAASLHDDAPVYDRPLAPPDPARLGPAPVAGSGPTPREPRSSTCCATARGSGASTTTSSSSTRWSARAATRCCCASSTRPPGPTPAAGWPSPPTATTGGARVDPKAGAGLVVAEAVMNLACVGARPIAVVDCLNFGNPEHPEVMWQLSEAIDGLADACRAFGLPVIGGNVSLYNETAGTDIHPTPVVGVLGLVDRLDSRPPGTVLVAGDRVAPGRRRCRRAASWAGPRGPGARSSRGGRPARPRHAPPTPRWPSLVRGLVSDGVVSGVHDVADRGRGRGAGRDGRRERGGRPGRRTRPDELFVRGTLEGPAVGSRGRAGRGAGPSRRARRRRGRPRRRPVATGSSVDGVLDLALDEVVEAWRDRLPAALGAGVTQG